MLTLILYIMCIFRSVYFCVFTLIFIVLSLKKIYNYLSSGHLLMLIRTTKKSLLPIKLIKFLLVFALTLPTVLFVYYIYIYIVIFYTLNLILLIMRILLCMIFNKTLILKPLSIDQIPVFFLFNVKDSIKFLSKLPNYWCFVILNRFILLILFGLKPSTKLDLFTLSKSVFILVIMRLPLWLYEELSLLIIYICEILCWDTFKNKYWTLWCRLFWSRLIYYLCLRVGHKSNVYWVFFNDKKQVVRLSNRSFHKF